VPPTTQAPTRWWVAFAVAAVVNVVAVYAPTDAGGGALFPFADKAAHLLLFAAVAFTGRRAGVAAGPLLAVLVAHALSSELVQGSLLARRSGDPWDVLADVVGAVIGSALGARRA
jgi:VanZ family protein